MKITEQHRLQFNLHRKNKASAFGFGLMILALCFGGFVGVSSQIGIIKVIENVMSSWQGILVVGGFLLVGIWSLFYSLKP